jgi:hypothetical protein
MRKLLILSSLTGLLISVGGMLSTRRAMSEASAATDSIFQTTAAAPRSCESLAQLSLPN